MMISDQQAQSALDYLKKYKPAQPANGSVRDISLSKELLERVKDEIERAPEMREKRLSRAGEVMAGHVTSSEVAGQMISRLISDALR